MSSVNKVILVGNLVRDPEIKYNSTGLCIGNISVATNSYSKDKKQDTEYHRVVLFGKLAEVVGQYAKSGKSLYIEGKLKTKKFQDKEGKDKYVTEIIADDVQFLGAKSDIVTSPESTSVNKESKSTIKDIGKPRFSLDDYSDEIPF
jgi:single-strand DNA-binding protein